MLKMDNIGLEVYTDSYLAAEVFAGNISYETIALDTKLGFDYDIENMENIFDSDGMEDIRQKVKDMASKAKANIIPWSKKLFNMVTTWFMNLIGKTRDLKSKLAKHFKNAETYRLSLNELKEKAKSSKETITIKDWGNTVLYSLSLALTVSASFKYMGNDAEIFNNKLDSSITSTKHSEDTQSKYLPKVVASTLIFNSEIILMCASILCMNVFDPEFKQSLKSISWDIEKWYSTLLNGGKALSQVEITNEYDIKQFFNTSVYSHLHKNDRDYVNNLLNQYLMARAVGYSVSVKNEKEINIKEMLDTFDKKVNDVAWSYADMKSAVTRMLTIDDDRLTKPREATVELGVAYDVLANALSDFILISSRNRNLWDFAKYVKPIETTRRKLDKQADIFNMLDDKESKTLLKFIMDTGSFFSTTIKFVDQSIGIIDNAINSLHKDVVALGKTLNKIK